MAGKNGALRLWRAGVAGAALLHRAPPGRNKQKQGEAAAAEQSAARRRLRAVVGALRRGRRELCMRVHVLVRDAVAAACSELDPSAEVHEPSPASPPGNVQFSCSSTPSSSSSAAGNGGGFRRHLLGAKRGRRSDVVGSPFQLAAGGRAQQVDRLADEFIWRFYDHLRAEAVAVAIAGRSSC